MTIETGSSAADSGGLSGSFGAAGVDGRSSTGRAGGAGSGVRSMRLRRSHTATASAPTKKGAMRSRMRRPGTETTLHAAGSTLAAMDLGLSGKVALVTGASQGIGLAIASELAAEGARVAMTARGRERLEAAAGRIGGQAYVHDTLDLEGIPALLNNVEQDLGRPDVVVINTGGPPGGEPLGFTVDQWEDRTPRAGGGAPGADQARPSRNARARLRTRAQRGLFHRA